MRVAGILVGDIKRMPDMRVKYGAFFEALSRRFEVVDVFDASLHGLARYLNAVMAFHPSVQRWKERFFKNPGAFDLRSLQARAYLKKMQGRADVVLQLGALLNPLDVRHALPLVLYTDNTTQISARRPEGRRIGLTSRELGHWITRERKLYHQADHICARSNLVQASLMEDYGIRQSCVSVVGGGVNYSPFPEMVERPADRPPTVLFIGEDFHRKGGDLLLRAFAMVREQVPAARLLVVTREAMPAGVPLDNVEVRPVTWNRETIADYYRRADVFILPSRVETWGDVLLEAMAFGLPCIGARGQAMEDIIKHEITGYLVDQSQTNALAGAMIRLLTQPETRRQMGNAARALVQGGFTWEHVVDRLAPVLLSVAQRRA